MGNVEALIVEANGRTRERNIRNFCQRGGVRIVGREQTWNAAQQDEE
jgi:hypothetical protein